MKHLPAFPEMMLNIWCGVYASKEIFLGFADLFQPASEVLNKGS